IDYMGSGKSRMAVALMKLGSFDRIVVVQDDRYNLMQARFSPDEKRIAFASRIQAGRSRLYVAPLGNSSTPKENWVALTDGKSWDTAPQWSPNGKLLYYTSSRDGFRCIWAQAVSRTGPEGSPFPIAHFHQARRSPRLVPFGANDMHVAAAEIVTTVGELTGNIWMAVTLE
ncbi:MAG: hypothetical protein ABIZ80_14730, partial [Bryobacteraceae bacterium]